MSTKITIDLPDETSHNLARLSKATNQSLAEIIKKSLTLYSLACEAEQQGMTVALCSGNEVRQRITGLMMGYKELMFSEPDGF